MLVGLVGKPNAGKSTFFKALTLAEVAIAPYPFTTIEPNEGVAFVKTDCVETELKVKCMPKHGYCIHGKRFVPVKLTDVAGLVPGAHLGKGKGNQFLDDLREADVLIHVLDASGKSDECGREVENYDVCKDVRFLQDEIDMWLYGIIGKDWQQFVRKAQQATKISKELALKLSGLKISENMIKQAMRNLNLNERAETWNDTDLLEFVRETRKLSKPIIIAANKCDKPEAEKNIKLLKEEFPELLVVPCSADSELALREATRDGLIEYVPGSNEFRIKSTRLNERQKKALEFIKKNVFARFGSTGVQECLNKAVFEFLCYIVVYPVENEHHFADKDKNVLPDALLMPKNSTALDLAFAVHTDIGNKFIAAIDARTHKRLAKDYKLKEGDVIKILTK
jgi:ribosome-binding ATPase YchF (GTP1/OBG family)